MVRIRAPSSVMRSPCRMPASSAGDSASAPSTRHPPSLHHAKLTQSEHREGGTSCEGHTNGAARRCWQGMGCMPGALAHKQAHAGGLRFQIVPLRWLRPPQRLPELQQHRWALDMHPLRCCL